MKYYILILFLCFISCNNTRKEKQNQSQKVIVIQPLGNFKVSQSNEVLVQIETINSNVVLRQNIPFPEGAYYKPRNRFRADSIIKSLKNNIGKDSVIVGLSNADISTTKNGMRDWGVMGLGYNPGKACVVSDYRLSAAYKKQQFYKLVLHELGHTEGLPHCKTKTCLMRDAQGKNHFEELNGFCVSCKNFLKNKGWQLL